MTELDAAGIQVNIPGCHPPQSSDQSVNHLSEVPSFTSRSISDSDIEQIPTSEEQCTGVRERDGLAQVALVTFSHPPN